MASKPIYQLILILKSDTKKTQDCQHLVNITKIKHKTVKKKETFFFIAVM